MVYMLPQEEYKMIQAPPPEHSFSWKVIATVLIASLEIRDRRAESNHEIQRNCEPPYGY
jgi:hypothetical protein